MTTRCGKSPALGSGLPEHPGEQVEVARILQVLAHDGLVQRVHEDRTLADRAEHDGHLGRHAARGQERLREVGRTPGRYPAWSENRRYRRLVIDRFPYLVFFHVPGHGPEVVAIAHARRRPGYWLRRIGP